MDRFDLDDELVRRAIADGRTLGGVREQHTKAIEAARERAKYPTPPADPNLPKWWEYEAPQP